ncbi:MAG: hypothetical protein J0I04_13050 [Paenarthrobacter ureafaciens]|uniref:hypothetical protein n=1 Tax=Paenarthrobacter ureafaciens TaxID=37931 RepID=UPI001ACD475E|nr:hypothetical protein [Paenarthrobacter ureafaciens]MBN9130558.1 hypothetical protein [Paenarthrobacter ureafaciens]
MKTATCTYFFAGKTVAQHGTNHVTTHRWDRTNYRQPSRLRRCQRIIGGLDDTVSSFTHLGARELDPVTGAFTSPDPVLHTDQSEGFTPYSVDQGTSRNVPSPW